MIAVKNRGKVRIKKLSRNHRLTWSRKFCLNKFLTDLLDSLRYLRLGWIWNHHQPNINHIINPRNLIPRLPQYHRVSSTSSFFFIMTAPALRKLWTLLCWLSRHIWKYPAQPGMLVIRSGYNLNSCQVSPVQTYQHSQHHVLNTLLPPHHQPRPRLLPANLSSGGWSENREQRRPREIRGERWENYIITLKAWSNC